MTDRIEGYASPVFSLKASYFSDRNKTLFAETLHKDKLDHAQFKDQQGQEKPVSERYIDDIQQDYRESWSCEEANDAPADDILYVDKDNAERKLGADYLSLTYAFSTIAHGHLDYLDRINATVQTKGELLFSGDHPDQNTDAIKRQFNRVVNDVAPLGINLSRKGNIGFGSPLRELRSSTRNNISNDVNDSRRIDEPKLSFLAKFLSRNISYVRTKDGQIKMIIRDYTADNQALLTWYHDKKNNLESHHVLVINGEYQNKLSEV